ncbi:response regulator [Ensifer soli]|uniref:response regulator n=1 Tax=Ciceribacter sp. sgz301302 TaxID=3342379 RepID=UPI0035BB47F6
MKPSLDARIAPWLYALLAALTAGAFSADLMLPLGTAVWLAYILAISLSFFTSRPLLPPALAALSTVLIVVGYLAAPESAIAGLAQLNRTLCILIAWILAGCGYVFIVVRERMKAEEWLKAAELGLGAAMAGEQTPSELAARILDRMREALQAESAALFVRDESVFRRQAAYGIPADAPVPATVTAGDGLLGQAARDGSVIELSDVPENYIYVGSALGRAIPRHLTIAAASADGVVEAVMELGFLKSPPARRRAALARFAPMIAVALRSAQYRATLARLLEETRQQADELSAQGDELRAANDELEAQARALQDSQARLEHQQAELEQNNAELEAQTQELAAQRDELARAQTTLLDQTRELEQSSRYKSEFLSNMSHELRTPLNSLLILAQLLAENRSGNLTEEQVKFARTIGSSGNDLLTLINDILDISKIEAGQVEIAVRPVALAEIAAKMQATFEPTAANRGLTLAVERAPDLPDTIVTDPLRLEQVLKNFLSNALKFTHKGGVTLSLARDGADIAFVVTDTGIGIPQEQQKAIFEPFRQADGTISRRYGGTGLGLSISRELAALLGGRIAVSSREGEGSAFSVILPQRYEAENAPGRAVASGRTVTVTRAEEPVRPPAPAVPALPPVAASGPIEDDRAAIVAGERVMLAVEDDAAFAGILYDLARELGFRCVVAGTADEGVTLAHRFLPQAIILDIGLPDHTGLFVLDRLKHDLRTRHIPVHVVSGADYMLKARALGAAGYTLKPVKREELVEALRGVEGNLVEPLRRVLVVEDDQTQLESVQRLIGSLNVETVGAKTAAECVERLAEQAFDCVVLDLTLPDATGLDVVDRLRQNPSVTLPPVIVYTGRDLSADDEMRLRRSAQSIIIKGAKSPERLLDEVTLFLHQVVSALPNRQQEMLAKSLNRDEAVEGRDILVVEDDVRNVYALTSIFEAHGARVTIARNGREALAAIDARMEAGAGVPFDLVLMDVMMPEMDGLTATREIRARKRLNALPVIMLTAKAMPQDQALCLEAGANDYLAKPLDVDKLLSLVRVWMPR